MRTGRGLDRFTNFTDAVVAIAITLMVLPLVDIASGAIHHETSVAHLLSQNTDEIVSFVISFLVIARLWLSHQAIFERAALYDWKMILCGFMWMLTIILLPFLTTLIAEYSNDRLAVGLYVGDMALSSICLTILTIIVSRESELRRADAASNPEELSHAFVTTGIFVLVFLIAVFISDIGLWALYLLFLTGPAMRILKRLGMSAGIVGDHTNIG